MGELDLDVVRLCPMIFGGGMTSPPLWPSRVLLWGVNVVNRVPQRRLRWSKVPVTFGIKINPEKISTINDMEPIKNLKGA